MGGTLTFAHESPSCARLICFQDQTQQQTRWVGNRTFGDICKFLSKLKVKLSLQFQVRYGCFLRICMYFWLFVVQLFVKSPAQFLSENNSLTVGILCWKCLVLKGADSESFWSLWIAFYSTSSLQEVNGTIHRIVAIQLWAVSESSL